MGVVERGLGGAVCGLEQVFCQLGQKYVLILFGLDSESGTITQVKDMFSAGAAYSCLIADVGVE